MCSTLLAEWRWQPLFPVSGFDLVGQRDIHYHYQACPIPTCGGERFAGRRLARSILASTGPRALEQLDDAWQRRQANDRQGMGRPQRLSNRRLGDEAVA